MSQPTVSKAVIQGKIYDKLDLLKEHAKVPQPDTDRMLQLINQVEALVDDLAKASS